MGLATRILFKHYRELVRPKEAEAWFNILPEDGGRRAEDGKSVNVVELKQAA